jgi:hypothetical protein
MIQQIENTTAFKHLEGFKQTILMKRDNRLKIEEEIVNARNSGVDNWQPPKDFTPHWREIVKEVLTDHIN